MYTFWAVPCTDNQRTPMVGPKYNLRYLRLLFRWSSSSVLPLGCPIPIMLSCHLLLPVHPLVMPSSSSFLNGQVLRFSLSKRLHLPPICVPFFFVFCFLIARWSRQDVRICLVRDVLSQPIPPERFLLLWLCPFSPTLSTVRAINAESTPCSHELQTNEKTATTAVFSTMAPISLSSPVFQCCFLCNSESWRCQWPAKALLYI